MQETLPSRKITLFIACMASFITPFMGSSVNLAIVSISKEFNADPIMAGWIATSFILASAAFLVPFGRLADIIGRKKIFNMGMALFFISSLLCGLSWSIGSIIVFRLLQGLGCSMIFGTSVAILTSVYPPQERGRVLGINVATVYIGLSLGPVLGGIMNHNFGWHSIFYLMGILGAVALVMSFLFLKGDWAEAKGEHFDLLGSFLYAFGLVASLYGIVSLFETPGAKYILIIGLLILIGFVKYELSLSQPVLNLKLFSGNITFTFSNLAAFINYSATFAVSFLIAIYLQVVMGYNSQTAGLIMLSQPILMAILSPVAGHLSDRMEPRILASLGMTLTTVGLLVFCFLNVNTSLGLIIGNLALIGIGFALFSSPNTNSIMSSVERKFFGVASSTMGTMRLGGQAVSMAIVTMFLALYVGNVSFNSADALLLTQGAKATFWVFTALCFCGIFASWARGNIHQEKKKNEKA